MSAEQNFLHTATKYCAENDLLDPGNTLKYEDAKNGFYDPSNPFFKIGLLPSYWIDEDCVATTTTTMDVVNEVAVDIQFAPVVADSNNDEDSSNTSHDDSTINTTTTTIVNPDMGLKEAIMSRIDQFSKAQMTQLMEIMDKMNLTDDSAANHRE